MERKFARWARCLSVIINLILLGTVSTTLAAWTPPIGIPMPPFGINEVAPSPPASWTADVPGFYFVREGGKNSGNGFPGNPRGSIPLSLNAGSVVIVAGTYNGNHNSPNEITANGTAASPVYIQGECCGIKTIFTQKWIVKGSYYIVENVKGVWANSSGNGKVQLQGHHGVLRHTDLGGDTGNGIGGVLPSGSYLVLWDNFIHDAGDVHANFDQDNICISLGADNDHIWILENELARCSGDGVMTNARDIEKQPTLHHIYIGRNISHDHKQAGFATKQAVDVIISQNTAYNARPGNSSPGTAISSQYGTDHIWILYNHIYNAESGIRVESTSGLGTGTKVFVIGNVIHDITDSPGRADPNNAHWSGAIVLRALLEHYVLNNTLWNYQAGIMIAADGGARIENNIFGARNASLGRDVYIDLKDVANATTIRNNLFDPKSVRIQWGDSTVFTFASATGKGPGGIQADPQFVNVAEKNFQLTSSSPAINAGILADVYATFLNRYGIDISKDAQGVPRPQGGAFDIGAYEYSSTVVAQPPLTPTNLQVHSIGGQ
jgi:Right handed beta helix region